MIAPRSIAVVLVSIVGLAGCAGNVGSTHEEADEASLEVHEGSATVDMIDVAFSPDELRIHTGTTVTFRNLEDMGHTVSADDEAQWGTAGSGNAPDEWMNKDDAWSWTFTAPGTYSYHCLPHATKAGNGYMGMTGKIIVE